MKKILIALMIVLSLVLPSGCSNQEKNNPVNTKEAGMNKVSENAGEKEKKSDGSGKDEEKSGGDSIANTAEENKNSGEEKAQTEEKNELKEGSKPGNLAKDIEFELWEDGKVVKLSDYRGEPVVLNFWTSWCPYCVSELPALNDSYNEYKEKGVKVIAINLALQDDVNAAKKAIESAGAEFIVANDHSGQAANAFGVRGIPASVFIDKDGVIYENRSGAMDKDGFNELIKEIVE